MRQAFLQVKSYYWAKKAAPWAAVIVKVQGGYHAFESADDYEAWKGQV